MRSVSAEHDRLAIPTTQVTADLVSNSGAYPTNSPISSGPYIVGPSGVVELSLSFSGAQQGNGGMSITSGAAGGGTVFYGSGGGSPERISAAYQQHDETLNLAPGSQFFVQLWAGGGSSFEQMILNIQGAS